MKPVQTVGIVWERLATVYKGNQKLYCQGKHVTAMECTRATRVYNSWRWSGEVFNTFLEEKLSPLLQPFNGANANSIIIMDNATIHHLDGVVELLENLGVLVYFLSPQSRLKTNRRTFFQNKILPVGHLCALKARAWKITGYFSQCLWACISGVRGRRLGIALNRRQIFILHLHINFIS